MADNGAKTRAELEDMGYGSTGEIAATENFYLNKDGVTFYYNVYDITPYAMGPVVVSLPFQMLEHMLGSNPVIGDWKIKNITHTLNKAVEIILKYFPDLTEEQRRQFATLYDLYIDWNAKINVI